jgi:hypothetical protein
VTETSDDRVRAVAEEWAFECVWSTHIPDERAGLPVPRAEYALTHMRPCGHSPNGSYYSLACVSCAAERRARPEAGRATTCPRCGETNRPRLTAARSL